MFGGFKEGNKGYQNCLDLVTKDSNLDISEKEARYCFGMSKMTIKDEISNMAEYYKLRFVEFLEFVGRIAYTKFIDKDELSEVEKLELTLDLVFEPFGLKKKGFSEGL